MIEMILVSFARTHTAPCSLSLSLPPSLSPFPFCIRLKTRLSAFAPWSATLHSAPLPGDLQRAPALQGRSCGAWPLASCPGGRKGRVLGAAQIWRCISCRLPQMVTGARVGRTSPSLGLFYWFVTFSVVYVCLFHLLLFVARSLRKCYINCLVAILVCSFQIYLYLLFCILVLL